jgi:hypothetical protein
VLDDRALVSLLSELLLLDDEEDDELLLLGPDEELPPLLPDVPEEVEPARRLAHASRPLLELPDPLLDVLMVTPSLPPRRAAANL